MKNVLLEELEMTLSPGGDGDGGSSSGGDGDGTGGTDDPGK